MYNRTAVPMRQLGSWTDDILKLIQGGVNAYKQVTVPAIDYNPPYVRTPTYAEQQAQVYRQQNPTMASIQDYLPYLLIGGAALYFLSKKR